MNKNELQLFDNKNDKGEKNEIIVYQPSDAGTYAYVPISEANKSSLEEE